MTRRRVGVTFCALEGSMMTSNVISVSFWIWLEDAVSVVGWDSISTRGTNVFHSGQWDVSRRIDHTSNAGALIIVEALTDKIAALRWTEGVLSPDWGGQILVDEDDIFNKRG